MPIPVDCPPPLAIHTYLLTYPGLNDAVPYFQQLAVSRVATVDINALFRVNRSYYLGVASVPPLLVGVPIAVLRVRSWFINPARSKSVSQAPTLTQICSLLPLVVSPPPRSIHLV
jgi:hypothetical protein